MQRISVILLLFSLVGAASGDERSQSADALFQSGKRRIEANCADCMGRARLQLEQGVEEINRAVDLGYADQASANAVLVDAYNLLCLLDSVSGSSEQQAYCDARQRSFRSLLSVKPRDPGIWYEYAMSLDGGDKQIAALRTAVSLDPKYTDARYILGLLLLDSGQTDEGVSEIRQAIEIGDATRAARFKDGLVNKLDELGKHKEAEQFRTEFRGISNTVN